MSTVDATLIRVLPDDVIDQIAAGEVIERPASVAKELVENALDAGAHVVQVSLSGGGLESLVVSDDGAGMSSADARTCLLRHATSKLRTASDLAAIRSLGFRGEALSSIAAVAKLTLTTRRPADPAGTRVVAEAGQMLTVEQVGCPIGTTIEVRELFYNTPARKSFMRSPATEQAHIVEAATRVVLGSRTGGLMVESHGRRLLDLSEQTSEEARLREALGRRVDALYPFATERHGLKVSGYVARPEMDRADTRGLWLFVNGRYVRDRMLQRALLDGYRGLMERGRFPIAVLFLEVPPDAVDVNVHPQKLEVRFRDAEIVFRTVSGGLTAALAATPWLAGEPQARLHQTLQRLEVPKESPSWYSARTPALAIPVEVREPLALAAWDQPALMAATGTFAQLRVVGQALGLYLVCEGQDELWFIDQHAAHERIVFERLKSESRAGAVLRQPLLFPAILAIPAHFEALVETQRELFLRYGFDVEPVGPGRFAVRTVPAALHSQVAEQMLLDLLDELQALEGAGLGTSGAEAELRILSRCACHASVRRGDRLSVDEARALLQALDAVDFGGHCPHGRPVYHRVARAELGRWFHR